MKSFLITLFLLVSFNSIYSQDNSPDSLLSSKYFMNMSFSGNLNDAEKVGTGIHLSVGYKLTDNLSIMFSSGYMSSFMDPHEYETERTYDPASNYYFVTTNNVSSRKTEMIPVELSLRYNFDFMGVNSYIMYSVTKNYVFNEDDFDAVIQTKNESTGEVVNSADGKAFDLANWAQHDFSGVGSKIRIGVLIPVMDKLNLDISYSFYGSSIQINSISFGLNFDL